MTLERYISEAVSSGKHEYKVPNLTRYSMMSEFLQVFKDAGFKMLQKAPEDTVTRGKDGQCWMILRKDMKQTVVRLFFEGKEYLLLFNFNDHMLDKCIKYDNQNGKHPVSKGSYETETNISEICDYVGMVSEAVSSGKRRTLTSLVKDFSTDMSMEEMYKSLSEIGAVYYDSDNSLKSPVAVTLMECAMDNDEISWCCGSSHIPAIYLAIPKSNTVYDISFSSSMFNNPGNIGSIVDILVYRYANGRLRLEASSRSDKERMEEIKYEIEKWI